MPFEPIAIVGQACTLPDALTPEALWTNVLAGRSSVSSAPAERWGLARAVAMGTVDDATDRTWSDAGGYVRGFDEVFDPTGFAIPEDEIRALDPLFQWVMHGAREALRAVGHDAPSARAGLILGNLSFPSSSMTRYAESVWLAAQGPSFAGGRAVLDRPHPRNRFSSGLPAHLAARALGLGAGAFSLDAACASSLYAMKLACDRLHDRSADVMVAGAVNINGRISPMRGDQLGTFLAQLPASMVAKVEVVPNPSAKNDPEGMAGIINIVLKENTDLGTSGGFTTGGGSTGQRNASGNLGYQRGALTLFANYGFMKDERRVSGYTNRAGLALGLLPFLESDVKGAFSPLSHSLNASVDYQIAPHDVLSSNLIASKRDLTRNNSNVYRELDAARTVTARSLRSSTQTNDDLSLDYSLSHKRTSERQGDGLATEFRVNRSRGDGSILRTDRALDVVTSAPAPAAGMATNGTGELTRNWSLKTDFTKTFSGRTKLESGYKGTLRQLENDFAMANFSDVLGAYVPNLARSNAFNYNEQVHAVYGVVSQGAGIKTP